MRVLDKVVAATLLAACASVPVTAGVFSLTNSTTGLFDASSGTRIVTVLPTQSDLGRGVITNLTVTINFAKADGQSFNPPFPTGNPYHNETEFILTSPQAIAVTLIRRNAWASGGQLFDGTIKFDQSAAQVVNYTTRPMPGTYRPTGPGGLNDFVGVNALGNWTLTIRDTAAQDALRFRFYTLTVTTAVPETQTLALAGAGLLAIGVLARRRRGQSRPVSPSLE